MTKAATAAHQPARLLRDLVIGVAGRVPAVPRQLAEQLSGAALGA